MVRRHCSTEKNKNAFRVFTHKHLYIPFAGVDLLRDGREDTYWQSDGSQPHLVTGEFQRRVYLKDIALHMDYKLDESYTPQKISIRVGSTYSDLREIKSVDLLEPQGWVLIPLTNEDAPDDCPKAWILQLAILANHQNGRDTHIRQVKVFSPRQDPMKALGFQTSFTSLEFQMYSTVR